MDVINTTGRRKTSVARIYMKPGKGDIVVNKRNYKEYFPTIHLQQAINLPFKITDTKDKFDIKVNINGGGISGQAEALRLAISRALVKFDPENRQKFRANGLLTRDPRMVERKKSGIKKARKRFQYSKR